MDDLFFNIFNDDIPLDSLIEEERPSMLPAYQDILDEPPFLLDDGLIPDSDEAFLAPPPPRKRRFMDHRTSIFTIIRDQSVKEPTPNHNKFLEKRRRAVALRMNTHGSGDNIMKQVEQAQAPAPRVIKKIEQKMRNRISAQLSRDRKKGYINILERQNADLRKENKHLKDELEALQDELSKMRERCAMTTADTNGNGSKTNNSNNNTQREHGGSGSDKSSNGSQNQSPSMTEEGGNSSEQNSEAIFRAQEEEGFQRHALSGNSLFLSLFSVLSVCAMIAMTGPNGMHADTYHAQAERLRVLAAMQPRCTGFGTQSTEAQALYNKIHKLKHELNASKFEKSKCPEPVEKQCPGSLLNTTKAPLNASGKASPKMSWGKQAGKTNLRSTAVMEYSKSQGNMTTYNNATNSTNSTGTLFCPSGVIVSNVMHSSLNKGSPKPVVQMGSYEALKQTFGQDQLLQIILPTTNLTVLKQLPGGKSEITQFAGARDDKLIEMICVVKGMNEVS